LEVEAGLAEGGGRRKEGIRELTSTSLPSPSPPFYSVSEISSSPRISTFSNPPSVSSIDQLNNTPPRTTLRNSPPTRSSSNDSSPSLKDGVQLEKQASLSLDSLQRKTTISNSPSSSERSRSSFTDDQEWWIGLRYSRRSQSHLRRSEEQSSRHQRPLEQLRLLQLPLLTHHHHHQHQHQPLLPPISTNPTSPLP